MLSCKHNSCQASRGEGADGSSKVHAGLYHSHLPELHRPKHRARARCVLSHRQPQRMLLTEHRNLIKHVRRWPVMYHVTVLCHFTVGVFGDPPQKSRSCPHTSVQKAFPSPRGVCEANTGSWVTAPQNKTLRPRAAGSRSQSILFLWELYKKKKKKVLRSFCVRTVERKNSPYRDQWDSAR